MLGGGTDISDSSSYTCSACSSQKAATATLHIHRSLPRSRHSTSRMWAGSVARENAARNTREPPTATKGVRPAHITREHRQSVSGRERRDDGKFQITSYLSAPVLPGAPS